MGFNCRLLCAFLVFASCLASPQDRDEKNRLGRKDDPAAREQWFRKGRQTRNGQPAAKMLHDGYRVKMKMRAQRASQLHAAALAGKPLNGQPAPSVGVWNPLGPRPIVDNTAVPDGYGPLAGRITALVVDQADASGNTVLVVGAYGGVWKTTNGAAADPTLVQWTPLIDDQPTLAVGAIALQPGNSNLILVGTGEPNYAGDSYYGVGILRSTDGGATWTTNAGTTDGHSLYGTGISQIAFSTKNPSVVMASSSYATIGSFYNAPPSNRATGLFFSSDAGATWSVVPFTNDNVNFYTTSASAVVYNPKEDKFYAVLPYEGVYVTSNTVAAGFNSFVRLPNQPGKAGVLSLAACPATQTANCPILRGAITVRPVLTPTDPDQMYVWFISNGTGNATDDEGIWKSATSNTGVVTWTQVTDTGITNCGDSDGCGTKQSFYNLYLSAVPNNTVTNQANTDLYAGTINIYKCSITATNPTCTTTGFQNLTHVYGCSTISGVHPDQHAIDFLQSNPNTVYFGNDGGVNRSLSAQTNLHTGTCPTGTTQANAFDNLNTHIGSLSQFMWGTNHPTDPNTLMGGTQDNGTMAIAPSLLAPGDAGWWSVNAGDGGYDWIDPVTPTNWYSAYTGVSIQYCTNTINCNTNTFLPIVEEDNSQGTVHQVDNDESNFYTPYILDPAKTTQLIVGTCRVWRGGNSAASWPSNSIANAFSHKLGSSSDASCSISDDPIQSLAAGGPSNANGSQVIWAGTSGGHVYLTTNAATGIASWTDVTGSINPDGFPISGLAMDPQDATGLTAYATIQGFTSSLLGHVWRTSDGGSSWTDITVNLPNVPTNDIVVDSDTHFLYAATDTGVFSAEPGGGWTEIGPTAGAGSTGYLPNVAVLHVAVFENGTDKRLRAFTHGRGAWETALVNPILSVSTGILSFTAYLNQSVPAQTVTLKNFGTTTINLTAPVILGSQASEFSVTNSTCGTSLSAGASCSTAVAFDPTSSSTPASAYIYVNTSPTNPVEINLVGNVITNANDFSFDPGTNPTSQTVAAGGTATYQFNLNALPAGATGFSPSLTLACSGLPNRSSCTFTPATTGTPGAVTLSIQTTATTTSDAQPLPLGPHFGNRVLAVLALPGLGLVVPMFSTRGQRRRLLLSLAFFVALTCILGMAACGGGGGSSGPVSVPGTPAGTYTIVVTGTYGTVTHTQNLTLTVTP